MTYSNDIVITINQEQRRAIMAALAIQRAQVESNLATIDELIDKIKDTLTTTKRGVEDEEELFE